MFLSAAVACCSGAVPALVLAAAFAATDLPLPMAESEDGMVFSVRPSSIEAHPLGHSAEIRAWGPNPRHLRKSDPGSPEFQAIESRWVVACHQGTFAVVEDRFFDARGRAVAVVPGSPQDQAAPVPGSIAHLVLSNLCRQIVRRP
jgi:hypothetical protein